MKILLDNRHCSLCLDGPAGVVVLRRKAARYESPAAQELGYDDIVRALGRLEQRPRGIVIDLREGTMHHEPAFEAAQRRARLRILRGIPRVAILVRSAVASLHVTRHGREDGIPLSVFQDEAAALAFARR